MGGDELATANFIDQYKRGDHFDRRQQLSEQQRAALDRCVNDLIAVARRRAAEILSANRELLLSLRDLLLEKKVIDAKGLKGLAPQTATSTT